MHGMMKMVRLRSIHYFIFFMPMLHKRGRLENLRNISFFFEAVLGLEVNLGKNV